MKVVELEEEKYDIRIDLLLKVGVGVLFCGLW